MYAEILVWKKLPVSMHTLTYEVPAHLQDRLSIGSLVNIPFRNATAFGVVKCINYKSPLETKKQFKPINSVVLDKPIFSNEHISFISTFASWFHMSESTIAELFLPPLQKRKIAKMSLMDYAVNSVSNNSQITFGSYNNQSEHAEFLRLRIKQTTLIVVPEIANIDEILKLLPADISRAEIGLWHSNLSVREQFTLWQDVQNNLKKIIIGTRGAIFLPFNGLKSIVVDFEHHPSHKQWDMQPRFNIKDSVQILASTHKADIHFGSFSPSTSSFYKVKKKNGVVIDKFSLPKPIGEEMKIVSMKDERRGGNYGLFSDSVQQKILNTNGDIALYLNRRGFSTSVGCKDCGYVAICKNCKLPLAYYESSRNLVCQSCAISEPFILSCPNCRSTCIQLRGAGIEQAETAIRRLLGSSLKHRIYRIDSDSAPKFEDENSPRILLGTAAIFSLIRWAHTDLFVFVHPDQEITMPEYAAGEDLWHKIQEVRFRISDNAKIFLQTMDTEHLIIRSLREPERFYRSELNARRGLRYPPYAYLIRALYRAPTDKAALDEAQRVFFYLQKQLTEAKIGVNLLPPLATHPQYVRGKFWYTIVMRLDVATWSQDLIKISEIMPPSWIIDPNPLSILSP